MSMSFAGGGVGAIGDLMKPSTLKPVPYARISDRIAEIVEDGNGAKLATHRFVSS